jgi:hypothetical protein
MSMVLCQNCDAFIDSDLDPDCFVEVPSLNLVVCQKCDAFIHTDLDENCFVEVPRLNLEDRVWCEPCRDKHLEEDDRA